MKDLILALFGEYTPVMTQQAVVVAGEDGMAAIEYVDVVAAGFAGVDWPWLLGGLAFLLCLYSFFRIVGMLFKG